MHSLATAPLFDQVEIDGQEGRLHDNSRGWLELPESQQRRSIALAENCSAIGGPRGKFKVANGSLWLQSLYRCGGDIPLSSVYPESSAPMAATWVTGELTAELGKFLCTSKSGPPVFEQVARITVRAGKVTSVAYIASSREQCASNVP